MNSSTSSSDARRYIAILLLAALLPFLLVPAFVAVVDPYDHVGTPHIEGFNANKPRAAERPHYPKMDALRHGNPASVLLGSSRVGDGLEPTHPGLLQPALNLGYGGHTWQDSLDILEALLARKDHALRQVVLHVDAFNANAALLRSPSLARSSLDVLESNRVLLSGEARKDAWITVRDQARTPTGVFASGFYKAPEREGLRSSEATERAMAFGVFLPGGGCAPRVTGRTGAPMDVLARVLALAYANDLDLYIVIGPSHARMWELEAALGLAGFAEQWKRELVQANQALAAASGRTPFPFWDFSGFNRMTTEPTHAATQKPMRWHYESSHFRPVAGRIVLDRVFGLNGAAEAWGDVGVRLTPDTLEAHLQQQRDARARWRAANPADVAQVHAVARELAAARGCDWPDA